MWGLKVVGGRQVEEERDGIRSRDVRCTMVN